jgi:hypothetical protein
VVIGENRPHVIAILSAADQIADQEIDRHIEKVNQTLPDYARVGGWIRIATKKWETLLTANGKPKRQTIVRAFAQQINKLYTKHQNKLLETKPLKESLTV